MDHFTCFGLPINFLCYRRYTSDLFSYVIAAMFKSCSRCFIYVFRNPKTKKGEIICRSSSLDGIHVTVFYFIYVTTCMCFDQFQGDAMIASSSSMFVEAIILPWNLSVTGNNGISYETGFVGNDPKNFMESCAVGSYLKNGSFKRHKVSHSSSKGLSSGSMDSSCELVRKLNSCSNSYIESSENQKYSDLSSHEISCSAIISGVTGSVILYCTKDKLNSGGFCSGQKVLLEFKSESFYKYQVCQIFLFLVSSW